MKANAVSAVIYCRVSTARQSEDELPIQSQRQRCHDKAVILGADVVRVYEDAGISGQTDRRPAFQEAIAYCETYTPTYLICWSSSRFARNRVDAQLYKRRLHACGVQLIYASMEIDRDSDGGFLTEGILELFDELYSRQVAADTRRSMIKAAAAGNWVHGRSPYGYKSASNPDDPKRKRLFPVQEEAETARRMFDMRLNGIGAKSIAVAMNSTGILNRGKRWNTSAVLALLRNPALIGRVVYGRRVNGVAAKNDDLVSVDDAHEAIISRSVWDHVQQLIDSSAPESGHGSPKSTHIFTGILRCPCGSSLQIETAKGRSRRYSYYNCRAQQRTGCCISRRLPSDAMDDWLISVICSELLNESAMQRLIKGLQQRVAAIEVKRVEQITAIERQIENIKNRNANLYRVLEESGSNSDFSTILARIQENNKTIELAKAEQTRMKIAISAKMTFSAESLVRRIDVLFQQLKDYNPKKLRVFFSEFIRAITVDGETVKIEYDLNRLIGQAVHSTCNWLPEPDLMGTITLARVLPVALRVSRCHAA